MKRPYAVLAAFISAIAFASPTFTQSAEVIVIYDKGTSVDSLTTQGVEASKQADGSLKIVNGKEDPWPGVHFVGDWNLSEYGGLQFTATSKSDKPITLHVRLDSKQSNLKTMEGVVTVDETLPPRERHTWFVEFPGTLNAETRVKLFAMRGKPGGIRTDDHSNDAKVFFDKSELTAIRPFETQNGRGDSWVLESIVAIPSDQTATQKEYLKWGPDKFFPMIDQFGQFKHDDWPGKTHSVEELRAQIAIEDADLAANQPSEFNEFGGWTKGPQLEATGSFRTQKIDGIWYLVDPKGRLFWSNGIDCVGSWNATTPISDREFYFDTNFSALTESGNPFSQFLSTSSSSVNNYYANYGEYKLYCFSGANLYLKYGDDWKARNLERVHRRLRSWGLNTIGNWSESGIYNVDKTPYVVTLGTWGRKIEGSAGYWGKFIDPFTEEFSSNLRQSLEKQKQTSSDPYCVGYFVDNEISWGEEGSLSKAALASPKDQPAKIAYVAWLKEKYGTIAQFNAAWGADLASWDALQNEPFQTPDVAAAKEDSNAFYSVLCEKYFSEILSILRELAPNKLYLGCRFAWTNKLARAASQKYCDVVSYNFYKRSVDDFRPVEGVDKPVIIGEFHFGALDRGLFHTGLVPCKDQASRAAAYEEYVKSALGNPWIVGAHWFEYGDEATTGRFDGENYQIGFVDVCDTPYPETISASRRVGYKIYEIRQNTAKAVK